MYRLHSSMININLKDALSILLCDQDNKWVAYSVSENIQAHVCVCEGGKG